MPNNCDDVDVPRQTFPSPSVTSNYNGPFSLADENGDELDFINSYIDESAAVQVLTMLFPSPPRKTLWIPFQLNCEFQSLGVYFQDIWTDTDGRIESN